MLDLTLLQDGAPAHKATETQIWSETIFSWFQIKWPPNTPDLSLIENLCGIFTAKVEKSKPYSKNPEYPQATVEACWEMICPETLGNLFQSISYQIKSVANTKGYFPLR
jgi:hypothetical protein